MKLNSSVVLLVGLGLVAWGRLHSSGGDTQAINVAQSDTCTVQPNSIYDGDTLRVLCSGEELKIRLCGIDAPEKDQAGGVESRDYLRSRLSDNAQVNITPIETDRYGRTVAEIFLGENFINAEMVKAGHAWHYEQYSGNCPNEGAILSASQNIQPTGTAPWEFRKQQRSN